MRKGGIGSHHSARSIKDEWLTPPDILSGLGDFDLDPCAAINQPWKTARNHYTIEDDGLSKEWRGRVFCNPPYGRDTAKWLRKMAIHGNGIALVFAQTETALFFDHVWDKSDAQLWIKGRLHFFHIDGTRAKGNSGGPSVLLAYGIGNAVALRRSGIVGAYTVQIDR